MKYISLILLGVLAFARPPSASADVDIQYNYPGGNVVVVKQTPEEVHLRQDYHTSAKWWFYWNFEAAAKPGTVVTFIFEDGKVIGTRGPAFSLDGGKSWAWLGAETVPTEKHATQFSYTFPESPGPVRFAFAPPYQQSDLNRFLEKSGSNPSLSAETLCTSEEDRPVERIRLGQLSATPKHRVFLTARHHACESMASYVMEGIFVAILADTEDGAWFRENVEVLAIPFVDKDGVEKGEQGKNRIPRDHGRDYAGDAIYNGTRSIRETVPAWADGHLDFALDLHCPHIRGAYNEFIYQVGQEDPAIWREQQRFAKILAALPGEGLPYAASNDLPFGQAWNTGKNYTQGMPMARWAAGLPGIHLATTIEIPYANVGEVTVTTERARAFGATLLGAMRAYLEGLK